MPSKNFGEEYNRGWEDRYHGREYNNPYKLETKQYWAYELGWKEGVE